MSSIPKVATVLLTHESPEAVSRMCGYWLERDPDQVLVVAYGGSAENFSRLGIEHTVFVRDPELRTRDHPRERQSYLGVFAAVAPLIEKLGASHVHLAEYDEIPLVSGLNARLMEVLNREDADVAGHRLNRVDGTGHPHFTFHRHDPAFMNYWRSMSRREDPGVVLSMLGCGSFWKAEAFAAVARLRPPLRIYLELMLPTAAHHLGFRVRPFPDQDRFMAPEIPKSREDFEPFRKDGAWRIHPVKDFWSQSSPNP
jgi:hypothetical protein